MPSNQADQPKDCRVLNEVLARIGDRWTIMTVGLLGKGPLRFNELRRALSGVTQRMLTLTLRGLERDGLVKRTQYPSKPPAVEYDLTARGQSLLGPMTMLAEWARAQSANIEQSRQEFDQQQGAAADTTPSPGVHRISTRKR